MNIKNTMCILSDLTKEQIDSLVDAMPCDGLTYTERDSLIGANINGKWGTFSWLASSKIISYTEMMQLLGKTVKEFTKSDLKTGMFVKHKDGTYRIVLDSILSTYNGYLNMSMYMQDLSYGDGRQEKFDIIAAYKTEAHGTLANFMNGYELTLIWERAEKTPAQKEMEVLQVKMNESQAKMNELQAQMKIVQAKL
jgi:hypothetical protein